MKESTVIAKHVKLSHFIAAQPRAETTLEKTTRMAKEITEQEENKRQEKIARLRKARHENEAEDATRTNGSEPLPVKKVDDQCVCHPTTDHLPSNRAFNPAFPK